ncbi:MAG TPA: ATP-binding protein [Xanthobacteraceae bacterium]|jgi:CheY-like chemotaxis protein|nr:ATP-binding protein [Xanthobacteraceae bacterium]
MAKAKRKKPLRPRSARRRRPRSAARETAPRHERAIEVALAGLAHDIRTPLTGILALAQLLHASDLPERERRWAETIKSTADHLARLTTTVVDAAKAETAGLVLREEPFALRPFVEAVAGTLTARAESKGLGVDIDIAADLPARVVGDDVRLRGVLENLIDNAVKFTERGRIALAVSAEPVGRKHGAGGRMRLTFTVADSGIGIVAADLKRLFRPFAQASETVARRYGGAGLGLVFVRRIARAMGGDVVVTSAPGRGSTFRLVVVVRSAAAARRPRTKAASSSPAWRVLCVEDNPFGRVVLGAVLGELGHRVSFAGNGTAAIEAAARNEHDIVLMDIALPGMDGLETARKIRALPGSAGRVPIIGVSGRTGQDDARAAKAAGMNAYLRKPASPAAIDEALRAVMAIRRA